MNGLEVTEVKVWPIDQAKLKPNSTIRANCQIVLNDCLSVKAKLRNGKNGLWVGAEGQYGKARNKETGQMEDKWFDAWRPISDEFKQKLAEAVISKYNEMTGNAPASNKSPELTDNIPF